MKIKLSPDEDYLNNKKTRNAQNCEAKEYNCGGFALETYSWYKPFSKNYSAEEVIKRSLEFFRNIHLAPELYEKEVKELLVRRAIRTMLSNFPNLKKIDVEEAKRLPKERKLIAFRVCFIFNESYEELYNKYGYDYDFHYVVRLKGSWYEKMGSSSIHKVKFQFEPWEYGTGYVYDSRIVFFIEQ